MTSATDEPDLFRHALATLAYRAAKVLRDPPETLIHLRLADGARSALEIVGHLGDLMEWSARAAHGEWNWIPSSQGDWNADVQRFFTGLAALDAHVASGAPLSVPATQILQGPIADSLTHVGQLLMLRRLAGDPVKGESYSKADITIGRVGIDQPEPRRTFEGDASARD